MGIVDDAGCTILHVDMDAFFASVEVRRRPELRGKPVVVGGAGPRGVVSSASYEARRYGVRSAMPGGQAQRLCPHAVFLPPDMEAYAEASRTVMNIFADVTPLVEPLSVDEAFLDVSGATRLFGRPAEIAAHIRTRVRTELRLTCSVGVAATKFMAKLASTRSKPDGLLVVPCGTELEFLHPLPIGALWGVGERTEEVLRRLGLRTIGDVAAAPVGMLRQAVGDASAQHLHNLAWARDVRVVNTERVEKSISHETTFDVDVSDPEVIRRTLLSLSTKVGARLRRAGYTGRTVAIKVRLADFRTLNRSRTLGGPTDVAREIFDTAWQLFQALDTSDQVGPGSNEPRSAGQRRVGSRRGASVSGPPRPGQRQVGPQGGASVSEPPGPGQRQIRLLGVRVEGLTDPDAAPRQLELGEREHGWRDAERAADAAAARFGGQMVGPASLLRAGAQKKHSSGVSENGAATHAATPSRSDKSPPGDHRRAGMTTEAAERDFDPLSDPLHPS